MEKSGGRQEHETDRVHGGREAVLVQDGNPPDSPCRHIREYRYPYGAVSPPDGGLFSLVMPCANTGCLNVFMSELSKAYPEGRILLLPDNAAWHRSAAMAVPDNIEPCPLPPYTLEFHPIGMKSGRKASDMRYPQAWKRWQTGCAAQEKNWPGTSGGQLL